MILLVKNDLLSAFNMAFLLTFSVFIATLFLTFHSYYNSKKNVIQSFRSLLTLSSVLLFVKLISFFISNLETRINIAFLETIGLYFFSPLIFQFVIQQIYFYDLRVLKLTKWIFSIPIILSVISVIAFFSGHYYLIQGNIEMIHLSNVFYLRYTPGIIGEIAVIFHFLMLISCFFLVISAFVSSNTYYKKQWFFFLLSLGLSFYLVIDIVLAKQRFPTLHFLFNMYSLTNFILIFGVFRFNIFKLIPFTRKFVIDRIDQIMVTVDGYYRVLDMNRSAENFFGVSFKNVIGENVIDVFIDFPLILNALEKKENDELFILNDKKEKHYAISISEIDAKKKYEKLYVLLLSDITLQKENELALKTYAQELEIAIAEKEKCFNIISTELKNPFQGIVGWSNHLVSVGGTIDIKKMQNILQFINKSSLKSYQTLENLLNWTKINTDQLLFQSKDFNLFEMVSDLIRYYQELSEDKSVQFLNLLDPTVDVFADKVLISDVFSQLIENSMDHNGNPIIIEISSTIQESELVVRVSDNGKGFQENEMSELFSLDTSKNNHLGLLLCKEYIEKNGGEIWIDDQRYDGATIYFTLLISDSDSVKHARILDSEDEVTIKHLTEITNKLIVLIEQKEIYLDSTITLDVLAKKLKINRLYLSQLINDTFDCNFNSFINQYRIKKSIEIFQSEEIKTLTIKGVASKCGFKSVTSFYSAFKKYTGMTPTDYMNES